MKKQTRVSNAVIRRLPRYYRHLSELQRKGIVRISSSALGKSMGLTASQIRQDLFCFGEFGSLSLLGTSPIPSPLATVFSSEAELHLQLANLQHKDRNK